jgi:Fe-S oxidoreductase
MEEESRKCTSCGFCQAACPVFAATLRPAFNARGKMLLLQEIRKGHIEFSPDLTDTFYACTTCGACTRSCPRQLKGAEVIEEVRKRLYREGCLPAELRSIQGGIESKGNVYGGAFGDRVDSYPPELRARAKKRQLKPRAEVLLFLGCLPSYLDRKIVPSLVRILDHMEVDYTVLGEEEVCCGLPLHLMGSDRFPLQARKVADRIRETGAHLILTPCAGCYRSFKQLYPGVADLSVEILHSVQYLSRMLEEKRLKFGRKAAKKLTYHDPCDLGRGCGIFEEPRLLLKGMPGIQLFEMGKNRQDARCCGGGGGLPVLHPEVALEIAARRIRDAIEVGAEGIVSGCPACKDQLRKGLLRIPREERSGLVVMDIVEIVLAGLE